MAATAVVGVIAYFVQRTAGRESEFGEVEALRAAKTSANGDETIVDLPWTADGVDQAVTRLQELKGTCKGPLSGG